MIPHSHEVSRFLRVILPTAAVLAACSALSAPIPATTVQPPPTAATPRPDTPSPGPPMPSLQPSPYPTRIPAIGELTFPYESADAGNVAILAGTTIDVTWRDAPRGAERYDFFLKPEEASAPLLLATDRDSSNDVSIEWTVPEHLAATLTAIAFFSDGSMVTSLPSFAIYSGRAPPADVCTVRTSGGAVDLFRERSLDSENFAYIIPGSYHPVLARTGDGWYRVDARDAYAPADGGTASETGWISDRYPIGLSGPCADVPLIP